MNLANDRGQDTLKELPMLFATHVIGLIKLDVETRPKARF